MTGRCGPWAATISTACPPSVAAATATHRDGWVFRFWPVAGESGVFGGVCVAQPSPLEPEQQLQFARIAKEAGTMYIEARAGRH